MNNLIIKIKKHFSKKSVKSKIGATLIELVAVVCILAITSTTCISGMFAMADIAKRGQDLSYCERTSDMFAKQLSLYGHSASDVMSYESTPTLKYYHYPNTDGFMDAEVSYTTTDQSGNVDTKYPFSKDLTNDYFLYADPNENYKVVLAKFTITPKSNDPTVVQSMELVPVLTLDNVKSIKLTLKKLSAYGDKYVLQYTLTTVGTNVWDKSTDKRVTYEVSSGVVLNNSNSLTSSSITYGEIKTKTPNENGNTNCIVIRSTSRSGIDIS